MLDFRNIIITISNSLEDALSSLRASGSCPSVAIWLEPQYSKLVKLLYLSKELFQGDCHGQKPSQRRASYAGLKKVKSSLQPQCSSALLAPLRLKKTSYFFAHLSFTKPLYFFFFFLSLSFQNIQAQTNTQTKNNFQPTNPTKPWVFWYWMQAAVSKAGITADLEAMKKNGIGGAYLMPIKGVANPPLMQPPVEQLSPLFWEMVKFSAQEANRLGLQLGMHFSDGFAIGGGPWITPDLSMQKIVWTEMHVTGGNNSTVVLPKPEAYKNYYADIAVYAFPTPNLTGQTTEKIIPTVTTSKGINAQFLTQEKSKESFSANDTCWIQYAFNAPFTCRSVVIKTSGNNFQAQRLLMLISDDGINFKSIGRLKPARAGWQDTDADNTYAIEPVTAKYYRFVYDKTGTEPGSEDLDNAKWKPNLKINGIELSGKPQINQYEGKSGLVWRVADRTTNKEIADSLCVPLKSIINITDNMDNTGHLNWQAPAGNWTILRIGHTSTGHTNATGGGGIGLECDKFNPEAIQLQFNSWFGEAAKQITPELTNKVLNVFHVDSWECGSQNWSPVFREEFKKRRGYDLINYLPAMAGIPVQSADVSERFLYDVRKTIVELIDDKFYATLNKLSHEKGCTFTAESVAPTMVSDGLLHYSNVDVPMGEFWLNSPTHDKPNDMFDAISGAHIYGKHIIQSESFTTVRMAWNEHPGMLKKLQDYNYALGINRLVYHVFVHNPWLNKKPGMTLDGVGLYFQRDQTWWDASKAWVDYAERCQKQLQRGIPVVDVAVFTGEELPSRSILPDRLVNTLPGIFGKEVIEREEKRLANKGVPMAEEPAGVFHLANMTKPTDWIDPLHGYKYDCINPDALIRLAKIKDGKIVLPGGASYGLLVLPGAHPMQPNGQLMSVVVANKLLQLLKDGATIIMAEKPIHAYGMQGVLTNDNALNKIVDKIMTYQNIENKSTKKDQLIIGNYQQNSFKNLNIEKDVIIKDSNNNIENNIAWTHRKDGNTDIYFISNQKEVDNKINISLRSSGHIPTLYNALTNETMDATDWQIKDGRTELTLQLAPSQSLFILLEKSTQLLSNHIKNNFTEIKTVTSINTNWKVKFDIAYGGPNSIINFSTLTDWTKNKDSAICYYSGTAVYENIFNWTRTDKKVWLQLGDVENIAQVKVNGINCGTAWTHPYQVDISKAIKKGTNQLNIAVTNTWANRLIGDSHLPENKRITNTTAPFRLQGKPLNSAGLIGPVNIVIEK